MVGSAKEIAVAIDDLSRCVCGQIAKSKYVCESTDCNSEFCFQCMQKYIHGRTIIPYKLCESHFHSEIKCIKLDEDLLKWENEVDKKLKSISFARGLLESKTVKPGLLLLGLIFLGVGGAAMFANEPDTEGIIVLGLLLLFAGLTIMPITEAGLKSDEEDLEELISNIPDNNPSERPRLSERKIITITNESVKEYLVFI